MQEAFLTAISQDGIKDPNVLYLQSVDAVGVAHSEATEWHYEKYRI